MSERARRYNKGKRRYELIPHTPLAHLADVYTRGAHKYSIYKDQEGNLITGDKIPIEESYKYELVESGADNWRKGASWSETIGAVKRHIAEWEAGHILDPDLKTRNLGNAAWGLFALMEFEKTHPELDDRVLPFMIQKKIGLDIDGVLADFVGHLTAHSGHSGYLPKHWDDPIIREEFDKIKTDSEFWLSIPPLIHGDHLPFEPHCYITARSIGADITQAWLDKHKFPRRPLYCVGNAESKLEAAKQSGIEVFVDDSFVNFMDLTRAGIFTYLYDTPYNQKYEVGSRRIKSLEEVM